MDRTISFKVETIEIKARPRRLETRKTAWKGKRKFVWKKPIQYTLEFRQPFVCHHSLDVEEELMKELLSHF